MGETRHRPRALTPEGLRALLHEGPFPVGESRALAVLQVNRTTLGRWLAGSVQVPHAAALVLRQMAEGIPPEGTAAWRGFRWEGDALVTPSGDALTARQLDGLHWQRQYTAALEREVAALRAEIDGLRRLGGAANDATARPPLATASAS